MAKLEKQLKEAFIKDLKIPDQYDHLSDQLNIKKSPNHHKYMNKPFFTKPKLIIAMSTFLFIIAGFVAFSLINVNAGVPVYKGMEVESLTEVSSAYALEEVSEPFIDEIESGLVPETTEGISYYAEQGETIRVKVNMENPNNHIILSFTLNGFMYQDLDFEEGPELNGIIQIIVEFRVANASGIQNITIDAIKYIDSEDNNAIKDAIFDADRTIRVGILYDDIPEILEVSETIAATSFSLDFTLSDPSSLSVDTSFLYVFDGTNIVYTQPVSIGANSFVVSDLMMGHTYEYAITTLFDPLDGIGARLFVLNQGILETLHGVIPSVTSTQEGVSSTLDSLEGVTITSVSLYLNDTLVSNITESNNTYVLENLLSNTTYELRTTYTYTFNGNPLTQTSVETFTTEAKNTPEVKVFSAVSFGNLILANFRVTDGDDTIESLEVLLYKDGELFQTLDNVNLTPQVNNPGSFTGSASLTYGGIGDYLIVIAYTYNLNEGNPSVTIDNLDVDADHTLRYVVAREIPELTLNGDAVVTLEVGSTYIELGAVFNDSKDGTGDALISGDTVNTSVVGTYVVLYNYTDSDNNQATQLSRIVNVVDTTAPVITLVGDAEITVEAGATYDELGATVSDNYDDDDVAVVGGDTVDTTALGTYIVTYNFTDANGNAAAEVTRSVTVVDTTAPIITIEGENIITIEYLDTFSEPIVNVTDNLDASRVITGIGTVDTSTLGTYIITYNTEDTSGNQALEVTLTVQVVDTTTPVITLNGDAEITLEAGSTYEELGALVTDNYDADDVAIIGGDTVDTTALGTYTITYNFTDSNGNVATEVTRTVEVIDTTAPVIILTGDAEITIQAGSTYSDAGAEFSDNLDAEGTIIIVGDTIDTSVLGTYTITYNATDTEGNSATEVERTVIVIDTTVPVITLNGDAELTIQAGSTYEELGALVTDNYDADDVAVVSGDTVDTSTLGTYTITYNFTDSNGNIATEVTRTVEVIDTTAPVIILTGDETVTIEVFDTYTELGATVSDNYDDDDVAVIDGDTVDTSILGTYTITYNFTDSNGNVATEVTRTVEVVDTTAPEIIVDGGNSITIEFSETFEISVVTLTDNYDEDRIITLTGVLDRPIDTNILGDYIITYNAEDTSGNAAEEVVVTVSVVDTTAPVISLNGDAEITIEAGETYNELGAGVTDNYDDDTDAVVGGDEVDTTIAGTYIITYNYTDTNGNPATEVTRSVVVVDTTNPVITLIGEENITIQAGETFEDPGVTITDNALVSGDVITGGTVNTSSLGTYTLTYNFTDTSGNPATEVTRTIEVIDTTAPIITLNGDAELTIQAGSEYSDAGAEFSDNLDTAGTIIVVGDTIDTSVLGTYTITYNATDTENNSAVEVTRTVEVVDTTVPVISIDGGNTLAVELNGTFNEPTVTLTDNYDADVDITGSGTVSETIDTSILDATYTITYSGQDSLGNVAVDVVLTITIVDTTNPTFDTILDQTYEVNSTPVDFTTLVLNASDNASQPNDLIITEVNNVDFNSVGTYQVTVTVTDEKGNAASQTFNVSIVDTTAPVISIDGGTTITLDYLEVFVEPTVTLTDNYDADVDITGTGALSATIDSSLVGNSFTITYNAADNNQNNASQVVLTIIISDLTAPTFDTINDQTIEASSTDIDWTTYILNASDTYADSQGFVLTLTEVEDNVIYDEIGTYTVTVSVTDTYSNVTSQTFNVTVEDTTAPVITLSGSANINVEAGTSFTDPGVTIADNVATGSVIIGGDSVDPNVPDTYVITYDYMDPSGNAATQVTRTVVVADTIAPVITLNGDATIYLTVNVDTYSELGATATDSFDGDLGTITDIVYTPSTGIDTTNKDTYYVDYSISDAAGNSSTVRRTVIVQDPPGSSGNPYKISSVSEFDTYFAYDNQNPLNNASIYFELTDNLDFTGNDVKSYYLLANLDGKNKIISNAVVNANDSNVRLGFFRYISQGSLRNITFNAISFSNIDTGSVKKAGLLAGEIFNSALLDNVNITNSSMTFNTSSIYDIVGGVAGLVSNATIKNLSMSDTDIVYQSSDSSSTIQLYAGLIFGYLSTNTGGVDITLENITSENNSLEHTQATSSKNFPGLLAGYAVAGASWGNLSVTNFSSSGDTLYMVSWPTSKTWTFGTTSQNFIITESGTSITSLTLSLPE